jgi:hypothetical protein
MTVFIRNAANLALSLPRASKLSVGNEDLKNVLYCLLRASKFALLKKFQKFHSPH